MDLKGLKIPTERPSTSLGPTYLFPIDLMIITNRLAFLFFMILQHTLTPKSFAFHFRQKIRGVIYFPSSSSLQMVSRGIQSRFSFDEVKTLLEDIGGIVRATGVRTTVQRSVQASQALLTTAQSFTQNPALYTDVNGQIIVAKLLKVLFENLGSTYIKLGQFIASSPTLFPADYVREFQTCLDSTPTVPYSDIRKIIQEDLKRPITAVFAEVISNLTHLFHL